MSEKTEAGVPSADGKYFISGAGAPVIGPSWAKDDGGGLVLIGSENRNDDFLPAPAQRTALRDIAAERQRQISAEGWTPEHDDKHTAGDMAIAASCYAWAGCSHAESDVQSKRLPLDWPWSAAWWKPKDKRSNLVRAGALILAEIERLDRAQFAIETAGD
ncbi:hypothetical protein [Duganella sp.]|uniref:hypothetical protein n=1 Tax=Duganella sp. TaxID=1904440 RepID=UPI0031CF2D22